MSKALLPPLLFLLAHAERPDGEIVPDVVYSHGAKELTVTYMGTDGQEKVIKEGEKVSPELVHNPPSVEWDYEDGEVFTLIMVDPDAPSRAEPTAREWVHWCVSNIPGDSVEKGAPKYAYVGAGPPADSGEHRYVLLLYKQFYGNIEISEHFLHTEDSAPHRAKWSAKKYALANNFGDPVGVFYYTAEHDVTWSAKIFDRQVEAPVETPNKEMRKARLYVDCFTFFNELELLKFRLKEMGPLIDHFVLVEAPYTHIGRRKPLYYEQHKEEIAKLEHADKIIHIIVDDLPNQDARDAEGNRPDSWLNERHARLRIDKGVQTLDLRDQDILIIADLDEIVDIESLRENRKRISKELKVFSLRQDIYNYDITSKVRMNGSPDWLKAKVLSYKMYVASGRNPELLRHWPTQKASSGIIDPGGWHLSYFGKLKTVREKVENMAHQEFNNMAVSNNSAVLVDNTVARKDILNRSENLHSIKHVPVEENGYLPREIEYLLGLWADTDDTLVGGLAAGKTPREELRR